MLMFLLQLQLQQVMDQIVGIKIVGNSLRVTPFSSRVVSLVGFWYLVWFVVSRVVYKLIKLQSY